MRTDEELRARFDRAVDGLRTPAGDVPRVVARARQRARRQRVAGAVAGVAAVVAAAVVVPRIVSPSESFTVDPVATPTATATATAGPPDQAAAAPLPQDHLRYGSEGVLFHRASDEPRRITTATVDRAVALADGTVVVQEPDRGPIRRLGPDGTDEELIDGGRLLTVHDGEIWFTHRTESEGEDAEILKSARDDVVTNHGVSAGVESFTDALAFLPDGRSVWLGCHLQCSIFLGEGNPAANDRRDRIRDAAGWYAGLAVAPSGDRIAFVDGPDPVVGGTSEIVVIDLGGEELARVPLPVGLALDVASVAFTADGEGLVAGDDRHAFVATHEPSGALVISRLEGDAGVALVPPLAVSPDEAVDVVRAFAEDELGWTGPVLGDPRPDGARVEVPLRVDEDAPRTAVTVERSGDAVRPVGGGQFADGPDDPTGWWFGVSAQDGRIEVAGQAPDWASGDVVLTLLSPNAGESDPATVVRDEHGMFEVALPTSAPADEWVVVLLTTRDGEEVTSFALVHVPTDDFAAG